MNEEQLTQPPTPVQPSQPTPTLPSPEARVPQPRRKFSLVIFIILIVIVGILGYIILGKKHFTLEGQKEKITIVIPSGYKVDSRTSDTAVIYDPDYVGTKEQLEKGTMIGFTLIFFKDNPENNVETGVEKVKTFLEMVKNQLGTQTIITETVVSGIKAIKNEGKGIDVLSDFYVTEYYLVTSKSIFIIGRVNNLDNPNFAENEFNRILNSIKISSK